MHKISLLIFKRTIPIYNSLFTTETLLLFSRIILFFRKVKWKVYSHYFKSIGWFLSISTIVMNAVFQSFSIGSSVWLSVWANDNQAMGNETLDTAKRDMYLGVYGALGFGQGTFSYHTLILVTHPVYQVDSISIV